MASLPGEGLEEVRAVGFLFLSALRDPWYFLGVRPLQRWVFGWLLLSLPAFGVESWEAGVREGGGGFYLSSPDQAFHLSLMGYGQFTGNFYLGEYAASRTDSKFGFGVRRVRVDMLATVHRDYEFLIEVGTPSVPASVLGVAGSDVGIVEARVTGPLSDEALRYRIGKFVVPFSSENALSSRDQDTVERSALLSSLIAGGFLDVQTGLMLFGRSSNRAFSYFVGAWNGGGNTVNNAPDANGFKQFQFKLILQPDDPVAIGLAFDTADEPAGTFTLLDHAFVPYQAGTTGGRRYGFNIDLNVMGPMFTFRSELMGFVFNTANGGSISQILGAYVHLGLFLSGSQRKGFEGILRFEWARLSQVGTSADLISAVLGWNVYFNNNVVWMMNYVAELPNQVGAGAYATTRIKHIVLNQLQVKF